MGFRALYGIGATYLGMVGALWLRARPSEPGVSVVASVHVAVSASVRGGVGAAGWFASVRPSCNAAEADTRLRREPPPPGDDGRAYLAACYAIAGKMAQAQTVIDALPPGSRDRAAGIVFEVVHPVADAGDDKSAGPMMRLVIRYQPANFMALYHAGMSEFAVGEHKEARTHLERFLELYKPEDGWRKNAIETLKKL